MNEMVIGMVESSNAEIRKQSAHKTLHPARNFFGKTIEKLRPLAQARDIKLKVGKIPDVEVRVDEGQMERVVQNLLSNSVKYSDKGQTVKVGAKKKGKRFILYVRDNGIGISKESLPYVFDQFYTEDKTRSSGNSQGVGLYVVREIMKDHGGEVYVKAKKARAALFNRASARSRRRRRHYRHCKIRQPFAYVEMRHRVLFGWAMTFIYRFVKYSQTRQRHTLVTGLLSFALFMFVWPIDFISVLVYGKLTFLAD